jgi:hypothetical protein
MIKITLLANTQVLQFEVKAETRTEAIKKAKNEAVMMGYTNLSVIG